MNKTFDRIPIAALVIACCLAASAEVLDRPTGIRIGQRMTLRPYVSASATYDSNVGGRNEDYQDVEDDVMWTVSPGFTLDYAAERWSLNLQANYAYHAYTKKQIENRYNEHSYGETLRWNWSDAAANERGWTLLLTESFQQLNMADDIPMDGTSNYLADRRTLTAAAAAQRRFNEHWHGDVNVGYYLMDYDNDNSSQYSSYYGYDRWNVGLEGGYAPTQWTDFIATVGYQDYRQDNYGTYRNNVGLYDNTAQDSQGYGAQVGIGSFATERISYRALAGWSRFNYGDGASTSDGFVYTISGNWRISNTLNTMLLATSYYQPSERELSSQSRVDSISWGLSKSLIRGKLRANLDFSFRNETHEHVSTYSAGYNNDYVLDILTGRIGFDYTLNRFFALFISGEYQRSWNDEGANQNGYGDYDRWRVTVGGRLTY